MSAGPYFLRWNGKSDFRKLETYRAAGGYRALRRALGMPSGAVVEEVKKGGLRGRGGAGFPAATKWGSVPAGEGTKYLVINCDEGEPSAFKDRYIVTYDPYRLIEGAAVVAHAAGLNAGVIYMRGEFAKIARDFETALEQARRSGLLGRNILGSRLSFDLRVHLGAGAYVCGEASALLESIEGKPGRPRLRPPRLAAVGLFKKPTVVNNVETVASVALLMEMGWEAWSKMGVEGDGGVKLYGLSGHVKKPGLYEFPMGMNLKKLIYEVGGGTLDDRPLKAVIPGGVSTPVLRPEEIDIPMSFASLEKAGSMFGTGCPMVIAEPTCMVQVALRVARFFAHESCGQCAPCREGSGWLARTVAKIEEGRGTAGDIELLLTVPSGIRLRTLCPLGDGCAMSIAALAGRFRAEFEEHVRFRGCPQGAGNG